MDIKELFDEPACSNNRTKEATCEKPEPGSASLSGCAFDGAQFSLYPFTDCAHIIHSPSTCPNMANGSYKNIKNNMVFTTDMGTNELIFGGEQRLRDGIDYIFENYKPSGIFIYATCVSALIGEDINAVAREKENELGVPVIAIHAAGFAGSGNFGAKVAGVSLLESIIGKKEPEHTTPYDINLLGEYSATDMQQYVHLLEKLGIRVLSTFSGDGKIDDIMSAHRAKLNVVVNSKPLVTMARKMKEKWKIPWVSVAFHGRRGTSDAIRAIVEGFGDGLLLRNAQKLIAEEESKLESVLSPIKSVLSSKKAVLNADETKLWPFMALLKDVGIELIATSIDKGTDDDIEKAESYLGRKTLLMREPEIEQSLIIEERGVDILVSDMQNLRTALDNKISFMDVERLSRSSYIGYDGLVNFGKDIVDVLDNPVFGVIAKKAPWER